MVRVRDVLAKLQEGRTLTLEKVSSQAINFRVVSGAPLKRPDVMNILEFNEVEFKAVRQRWEHKEYMKMFMQRGVFTLGAF